MKPEALDRHGRAAQKLERIIEESFNLIKKGLGCVSEYEVQRFILHKFREYELVSDRDTPIVAAAGNTAFVHYYPSARKSKIILKDSLVMVDIWAREKGRAAPFADITWMAVTGNAARNEQKAFKTVIAARDRAVAFIKKSLAKKVFPENKKIDGIVREYFRKHKVEQRFLHATGHSLGLKGPHGDHFLLSQGDRQRLRPNIPFTIEPGLYFPGAFGIRSEIDCYVTENYKLVVTTKPQKKLFVL